MDIRVLLNANNRTETDFADDFAFILEKIGITSSSGVLGVARGGYGWLGVARGG